MADRLSRSDWLKAGLEALAQGGADSLKADVLAKRLGVSRGSFYWHFADLDAFHGALITAWQDAAVDAVLRRLQGGDARRLRELIAVALRADPALEIGMRAWAASSQKARAAVAMVDARRLEHLRQMLVAVGVEPGASKPRAHMIYWTYLGGALSRATIEDDVLEHLIVELADLAMRGDA